MLGAIKYNLSHVFDVNGRDARQTFWYYMLFLFLLKMVVGVAVAMPMYVSMFSSAFDVARSGADPQNLNATMFAGMSDQLRTQMSLGVALGVVASVLFAAAFVRRLHDSGKPGWIVLLALVPYLGTLAYNYVNIDSVMATVQHAMTAQSPDQAMADQTQIYARSVFAWVGYLVVIVFGVMKSDGPNKYGEAPVRF